MPLEPLQFARLRLLGEKQRRDRLDLADQVVPLVGRHRPAPALGNRQAVAQAETRLPADPLVAAARPGAGPQVDQRLFAPLGRLEGEAPQQRQFVFGDVEEGEHELPGGRIGQQLLQEFPLVLRRGKQPAGNVQILPLADHGHHAAAVRQPESLPARLCDEIGVIIPALAEGQLLQRVGRAAQGKFVDRCGCDGHARERG